MRIDGASWAKKQLLLVFGEETAIRDRVMQSILEAAAADEFDQEEILADQAPPLSWIGSAGTAPFLSDRRVLTVRHVLRVDQPESLLAGLSSLPPTALLILIADEETKGDSDRQGRQNTILKEWETVVRKAGGEAIHCKVGDAKAAFGMIRSDAKEFGKEMTTVAAEALLELCGGNYTRAHAELYKLAIYVGAAPEIREKDVYEVAIPSREWNIFKLVDAVITGQPGIALRQLKILVSSPTKAEDAANRSVIPMMSRQVKLLWQARLMQDQRIPIEKCQALWPMRPNLATEKDWTRRKTIEAARKISAESVELMLKELAEADARLKGMLPGTSPMETLELCVLRCCEIARPPARAR